MLTATSAPVLRFTITVAPGVLLHLRRHESSVTAILVAGKVALCFAQAPMERVSLVDGYQASLFLDTTMFLFPGDQLADAAMCLSLPVTRVPRP